MDETPLLGEKSDPKTLKRWLVACFLPVCPVLLVLIPQRSDKGYLSFTLYLLFQILYDLLSYPIQLFTLHFCMPGARRSHRFWIIAGSVPFMIAFWWLCHHEILEHGDKWVRTAGGLIFVPPMVLYYLWYALSKDRPIESDKKRKSWLSAILCDIDGSMMAEDPNLRAQGFYFRLWGLGVGFWTALLFSFYFCQILAIAIAEEHSGSAQVGYFIIFNAGIYLLRWGFCSVGRRIDMLLLRCACDGNHAQKVCLELLASQVLSCFYFVFYRSLFAHIDGWASFAVFAALHVALEIVMYVVRASPAFFRLYHAGNLWVEKWLPFFRYRYSNFEDEDEARSDFVHFLLVDYGNRLLALCSSTTSYALSISLVNYGWNAESYDFGLQDANYGRVMAFCAAAIGVEALAHLLISFLLAKMFKLRLMEQWGKFAAYWPHVVWLVASQAHISSDILLARNTNWSH